MNKIPKLDHSELVNQWRNMGVDEAAIKQLCKRLDKLEYDFHKSVVDGISREIEIKTYSDPRFDINLKKVVADAKLCQRLKINR